jgi:hypothetical protein
MLRRRRKAAPVVERIPRRKPWQYLFGLCFSGSLVEIRVRKAPGRLEELAGMLRVPGRCRA